MKKLSWIAFFIAFFIGTILAGIFVTRTFNGENIFGQTTGSGIATTETRDIAPFSKVEASGALLLEIIAQAEQSVEVTADDNLLSKLQTEVVGDTLKIYFDGKVLTRNAVKIKIAMPNLVSLDIAGANKADVSAVASENLYLEARGASKISINGTTQNLKTVLKGASSLDAENLEVGNATVKASGASNAIVNVSGEIEAIASGASDITYIGKPKNIRKKTSGASSINQR